MGQTNTATPYVGVFVSPTADGGVSGDGAAGVCVDNGTGGAFDGGYAEVGAGDGNVQNANDDNGGVYAVIDGSDANPAGHSTGYAGISTYDDPTDAPDACNPNITSPPPGPFGDPSDEGTPGPNGGGCFTIRDGPSSTNNELVSIPGVPFACGNQSGSDWYANSTRDGCTIP